MGPGHLKPNYSLFCAIRQIPAAHYPQIFLFIIKNRWNEDPKTCLCLTKITDSHNCHTDSTLHSKRKNACENIKWYLSIFSNCFETAPANHLETIMAYKNGYRLMVTFFQCRLKNNTDVCECADLTSASGQVTCSRKKGEGMYFFATLPCV